MPRRPSSLDLTLPPRSPAVPAYRWLYDALRDAILGGALRPGARLPSTREIGAQHGLARGTVVHAFEQLAAEGYLEGAVGAGTFVARCLPDEMLSVGRGVRQPRASGAGDLRAAAARRPLSSFARRAPLMPPLEIRPTHAFRANIPALDLFPTGLWAQLAGRRSRRATLADLESCEPLGYLPLRQAVADYLGHSRGVRCTAGQVAIVTGVQEAIELAGRLLLEPGDRAAVEEPGYHGATAVFEALGGRVAAVPVDGEGLRVDARALRGARLVYLTPAHQYPLGVTMSLPRRLALLDWARRTGARLFEDDYDSEYRYAGRPVPALQGLDDTGAVLFAGSFNKVLFASLRLGYLVLPDDLVDAAAAVRSLGCRHPPLLEQRVLVDFIAEGHFGRHLRRMREVYAGRLAALMEGARERLGGWLELSPVEAGLQTTGTLPEGVDDVAVARAAAARRVEVMPLSRFYRGGGGRSGLQLGFAAVDRNEIGRGIAELAAVAATAPFRQRAAQGG